MRARHSPPTPFAVQINIARECSLHSLLSMYRKGCSGTACSLLTAMFPVIVKESQACLQPRSGEQWCHRCFFRCKIPVGHTGRSQGQNGCPQLGSVCLFAQHCAEPATLFGAVMKRGVLNPSCCI